jgi:plasmid stability protein
MNDKQRRRVERLVRSRDLGVTQGGFPATSAGGRALAGITGRLEEIENLEAQRSTNLRAAQQGNSKRSEARKALRAWLKAISETTETIALDSPEVKDKFRIPRTNLNDQNLLGLARSILAEVTPFKTRFIEYDMPSDFLETFSAVIEDFEQAISQQNTGRSGRSTTNVAIDAALDAAEQDLERLDTAMRNKFAGDAATLSAWKSAARLHGAPQKQKTQAPTPTK